MGGIVVVNLGMQEFGFLMTSRAETHTLESLNWGRTSSLSSRVSAKRCYEIMIRMYIKGHIRLASWLARQTFPRE